MTKDDLERMKQVLTESIKEDERMLNNLVEVKANAKLYEELPESIEKDKKILDDLETMIKGFSSVEQR